MAYGSGHRALLWLFGTALSTGWTKTRLSAVKRLTRWTCPDGPTSGGRAAFGTEDKKTTTLKRSMGMEESKYN